MKQAELQLLLERYTDGTIDRAGALRLLGALNDPKVAAEMKAELRTMRMLMRCEAETDGEAFRRSLVERLRAQNDGERFVETWTREVTGQPLDELAGMSGRRSVKRRVVRRRRTSWMGVGAAMAAVLTLVGIGAWLATRPDSTAPGAPTANVIAALTDVRGSVTITRHGARIATADGTELVDGDEITCDASASADLRYYDGTIVRLDGSTRVALSTPGGAKRLVMHHGHLDADVAKQPSGLPMAVVTTQAETTVLGTRFTLDADAGRSRLEVTEGLVRFERRSDHASVEVPADHYAVAADGVELAVTPLTPPTQPVAPPAPAAPTVTLLADATLENGSVVTRGPLKVERSAERTRLTYIKFEITGLNERAVRAAKLKLHAVEDSGAGTLRVWTADDNDWSEDSKRSAKLPGASRELSQLRGKTPTGSTVAFDVTGAITGDGVYTFVITADKGSIADDVWFDSRSGKHPPRLELTVD